MSTAISSVIPRQVWDSRGRPTVEVDVVLDGGARGRAIAPSGASTGTGEALDLRDGGHRHGGFGVAKAIAGIANEVAPALSGMDVLDQSAVDTTLERLDGTAQLTRLGGNALIATSMAVAHAAAAASEEPLWRYFAAGRQTVLPVPEVQIFGGGAHASGALDLQDLMVTPFGASSFREAMEWVAEVYLAAGGQMKASGRLNGVADEGGYWPVFESNGAAIGELVTAIETAGFDPQTQMGISIDFAASQFFHDGQYHLTSDGRSLSPDDWQTEILGWLKSYPIRIIEDPFHESDIARHAALLSEMPTGVQLVGDDLLVTNAERVRSAAESRACNTLLCKPNQAGTLTRARAAFDEARAAGMATIVSARSGESEDTTIAHLAVGWASAQVKVGSFSRSERMAKWNELLRIEEELAGEARYAGAGIFGKAPLEATGPASGAS